MDIIEERISHLRDEIIEMIDGIFLRHCKRNEFGDLSLYTDVLEGHPYYLAFEGETDEISEFWYNTNEVYVTTSNRGSTGITKLELDNLIRCYRIMRVIEPVKC